MLTQHKLWRTADDWQMGTMGRVAIIVSITSNILHLETYKTFSLKESLRHLKLKISIPILLGGKENFFWFYGEHQMIKANPKQTELVKTENLESQFAVYW